MIKEYHVSKNLFPLDVNKLHIGRIENDGTIDYEVGTITVGTNSVTYQSTTTWRGFYTEFIQVNENEKLTFSPNNTSSIAWSCSCYDEYDSFLGKAPAQSTASTKTFTLITGTQKIRMSVTSSDTAYTILQPMLNTGGSALPYEPYSSEVWHEIPYRILNTSQDTITSLPVDIYTDGQPIGANLFDKTTIVTGNILSDGTIGGGQSFRTSDYIPVAPNTNYAASYLVIAYRGRAVAFYQSDKTFISSEQNNVESDDDTAPFTFTTPNNCYFMRIATYITPNNHVDELMLNTGSTALPYQPYAPTIIKGNMSQSGTPTPTSPITPSECGERTGNLFDKNATDTNNGYVDNGYLTSDGTIHTNNGYRISEYIPILSNQKYITYAAGLNAPSVCFYDANKNYISGVNYAGRLHATFTTPSDAKYLRLSFRGLDTDIMFLNLGDTASPYEPYGFKLDIKSGNTTTPVYLGETLSTREIKKLVFDGTEPNWIDRATFDDASAYSFNGLTDKSVSYTVAQAVCTHFPFLASYADQSDHFYQDANNLYFTSTQYRTLTDWKTYLQQQYAAGTPVTVWYVLATETTGIVNEPIRKIGDYADSVSVSGIPTTSGGIEFDVTTSLKPSEVDLTYHGWHPVQSVHEKSKNLFDINTLQNGYYGTGSGFPYNADDNYRCFSMTLSAGTYTIFAKSSSLIIRLLRVSSSSLGANAVNKDNQAYTFTLSAEEAIYVSLRNSTTTNDFTGLTIMLNSGSSGLPYAPYWE